MADRELIERQEPRRVNASPHTDSNVDLHRWFCEPWCPKCGFGTAFTVVEPEPSVTFCVKCKGDLKPGLHTRCPETRVEGLEWHPFPYADEKGGHWQLSRRLTIQIDPDIAARLLVAGVMWPDVHPPKALPAFARIVYELMKERGISYPEAVAIARHRATGAEEANA